MKQVSRLRRALQWIRRIPSFPYYRRTGHRLDQDGFDQVHGTDTAQLVQTRGPSGQLVNRYETASVTAIATAIDRMEPLGSGCTFLDLGCGKGKPIIVAARYPFGRVVGVDISAPCLAIARKNVEICGLSGRIELVLADVCDYSLPAGALMVYLYNPFPAKVLSSVIDSLVQRIRESADPVAIIYMNPEHADVIDQAGVFRRVLELPGEASPYERVLGYRSLAWDLACQG